MGAEINSSKIPYAKAALAAELVEGQGLSLRAAESQTGIDHVTISRIIKGVANWGEIAEEPVWKQHRETQNKALQAAWRSAAAVGLIEAHKPEKLEKASYYQLIVGSSIATEKANLLAGLPTEITASVNVHIEAKVDGLVEALGQALLLKQAEPPAIDVTPGATLGASDNKANDKP